MSRREGEQLHIALKNAGLPPLLYKAYFSEFHAVIRRAKAGAYKEWEEANLTARDTPGWGARAILGTIIELYKSGTYQDSPTRHLMELREERGTVDRWVSFSSDDEIGTLSPASDKAE